MSAAAPKKILMQTWGCQMNVYDSARILDSLAAHGYEETTTLEDADLVVFNTCHIREKAAQKLYSELGRLRDKQKKINRRIIVAVGGCVAQAEGEEIQRRAQNVDIVFGPQTYHRLPEMIARLEQGERKPIDVDFPVDLKFDFLEPTQNRSGVSAFLSIQEGCDHFCTYCVVPYTRGSEYSRPPETLLTEAKSLVAQGARELTLLGQNVNAYHGEDKNGTPWSLAHLIAELSEIQNLVRIRYMTSHPLNMTDDLIAAHGNNPKLMPFLHLPIQSGSDTILEAMNRRHKADDYLRIVEKLHTTNSKIALSSDFIVGFPGETEAAFQDTMKLVRAVTFAQAFSFKYSRRPGTPAAAMKKQVPEKEKTARLQELQTLLRDQQAAFNQALVGQTIPVLFEGTGRAENQLFGKTPYLNSVHMIAPPHLLGQEVPVLITESSANTLVAAA